MHLCIPFFLTVLFLLVIKNLQFIFIAIGASEIMKVFYIFVTGIG